MKFTVPSAPAQAALRPVLAWLEAGAPHVEPEGWDCRITFDMNFIRRHDFDCGTACCMIGAAAIFSPELVRYDRQMGYSLSATQQMSDQIGIGREDSRNLAVSANRVGAMA